MNRDHHVRLLQLAYANILADATLQFGLEGALERVTERKRQEQQAHGAAKAAAFGITSPEGVFTTLSESFGCADWAITPTDDGFSAEARSCVLCGLAKQKEAPSPCRLYCLDPMAGMVKGLQPDVEFNVLETLWNGEACRVDVRRAADES